MQKPWWLAYKLARQQETKIEKELRLMILQPDRERERDYKNQSSTAVIFTLYQYHLSGHFISNFLCPLHQWFHLSVSIFFSTS